MSGNYRQSETNVSFNNKLMYARDTLVKCQTKIFNKSEANPMLAAWKTISLDTEYRAYPSGNGTG